MGCLFVVFASVFPRLAVLFLWVSRPTLFTAAFGGSWFLPLVGLFILPFTTLTWAVLWSPISGVSGWDWLWMVLAVFIDVASIGASGYTNRNRMPGYYDTNP